MKKNYKRFLQRPLNHLNKDSSKSTGCLNRDSTKTIGFQCSKSSINLDDDNSFVNFFSNKNKYEYT